MRYVLIAALAAFILLPAQAQAAINPVAVQSFCGDRYCSGPSEYAVKLKVKRHKVRTARGKVVKAAKRSARPHGSHGRSLSLDAVVAPLAEKARAIIADCGSRVISAHRPGARVRDSGRLSLHASYPARAVDLKGNPSCIYRHLQGWPGGYSVDSRIGHIHISYEPGGREWGARFQHHGTRYAARHRRYAAAR